MKIGTSLQDIGIKAPDHIEDARIKQMMKPELDRVLQDAKEEIAKQIQTDKATLITIFGIFASITSFLTIEFQFLKTISSIEKILGFTLVLFALLFGF